MSLILQGTQFEPAGPMELIKNTVKLAKSKIISIGHDSVKHTKAINLKYVNDLQPGINRIRKGTQFSYIINDQIIKDKTELNRIKSLVIPPAWKKVWICPFPNGHIQATGIDSKGRKQYRYHPMWTAFRKEIRFYHMHHFGKTLPIIRKRIKQDLSLQGIPMQKVLALIVSIMDNTGVRVGNNTYEKIYGSYGVTTLKDRHVDINKSNIVFSFRGKKGIDQNITLKSQKLAKLVRQCKEIPGKELFQYLDENGERRQIDSGMVNNYIAEIAGENFTAKDFRTWFGTVCALEELLNDKCDANYEEAAKSVNKRIIETLDIVAKRLGNTRTICKKYYVHPIIMEHYTNNNLEKFIVKTEKVEACAELSKEEMILMTMLGEVDNIILKN